MSGFQIEEKTERVSTTTNKDIFVAALKDKNWRKQLAHLADIFGHLNELNLKLHGTELNLITFKDTFRRFIAKL